MTSQLNVDTIVDKAGSGGTNVKVANTSTYVSDGGAVTQNTVQGLAKVWFNIDQEPSTQTFRDSFNVASSSDEGTGVTKLTFTNAFNNDGYSAAGMAKDDSGGSFGILRISSPMSTTQFQFMGESHDDTNVDCDVAAGSLHGDLA